MAKLPRALVQLRGDVRAGHIRGIKAPDNLPEGRVARRLVDNRDAGRIAKTGDLASARQTAAWQS